MRFILLFLLLPLFIGCDSKPLPVNESNLPTVGIPPPPPISIMGKKEDNYSNGINSKKQ